MVRFGLLPWEYGVRNLFRRPGRSALTTAALATVILLVLAAVGFVRGLEGSLSAAGDPDVVLVYSLGMGENLEYSSVPSATGDLIAASLPSARTRYGEAYVSGEYYLATRVVVGERTEPTTGLIRGVAPSVLRVRRGVEMLEGRWPRSGEILAGRLAATKLGCREEELAVGRTVTLEGRVWRVSGHFAAAGSVLESELWCPLDDLAGALERQDLTLVALVLAPGAEFREVDLFCKRRLDLQLEASRETEYFAALAAHYRPVRMLAWLVAWLMAVAGAFAAMNTMVAAAAGRIRELAALETIGFGRGAIALSLIQESVILGSAASLVATFAALLLLDGVSMRFTMGALRLDVDGVAVLAGCGVGLLLSVAGALPAAVRAMRMPVAEALKAV